MAIGDALAAAVEFKPRGSFESVRGYRGGGPHGLAAGEWTDDTSMALALADSVASVGWDLDDQARRYVSWWREGRYSVNDECFDIGMTVKSSLARFERSGDARSSGQTDESASGNGSIMRLAPVPIWLVDAYPDRIDQIADLAAESSLPTHASPQCLSACRYFAVMLVGLVAGVDRDEVFSGEWPALKRLRDYAPLHPEIDRIAAGSFFTLPLSEVRGSGYVVDSLEAGLWAFRRASDFRDAVLTAVNLGDDADTTGAVCGQLAGAYWGRSGIDEDLLAGLAGRDIVESAVERLLNSRPYRHLP